VTIRISEWHGPYFRSSQALFLAERKVSGYVSAGRPPACDARMGGSHRAKKTIIEVTGTCCVNGFATYVVNCGTTCVLMGLPV
jgi:hypothetical protein